MLTISIKNHVIRISALLSNLYGLFKKKDSVLWVGEVDGIIAGCCGIYPTEGLPKGFAELVKFYMLLIARGKGLRKALMDQSIVSAKEIGYQNLYLEKSSQIF
jgi:putative acetyltransferase